MRKLRSRVVFLTLILGFSQHSHALGTLAGTLISNQAIVSSYIVGGITQLPINSNTSTFVVDRKINFTFTKNDLTYVTAVPNQQNVILSYTVTNIGNSTQDFGLTAAQQATGATDAFGGLDTINLQSTAVRADGNGNGTYQAANDTRTWVDELAPDTSRVVFVVGRIPSTATNNAIIGINLSARARAGGVVGTQGGTLTQSNGIENPAATDTVFADGTGTGGGANRDSILTALNAYKVVTATIGVIKSSAVISDPINNTTNPKRIPGAIVEYTLSISNTGSATATAVLPRDTLATTLTYMPGTLFVDNLIEDDNTSGADETNPNGGGYTAGTRRITGRIGTLNAGETKTLRFKVTIN